MVPTFDFPVSSLLCTEENTIFEDVNGVEDPLGHRINQTNNQTQRLFNEDDAFNGLSEECLALMVKKECDYLPADDYLKRLKNGDFDLDARMEAIIWILKVQAYFNFGPLCAYLAISYLDRFLSAYEIPEGKAWAMQMLAVACLSLAAKLEETEVPSCMDLQVGELKFVFGAKAVQRMELTVLSTLNWRMQAVTPYSFVDHFLETISGDQKMPRSLIDKAMQLILSSIRVIDFLEFKPSEIAAAAAISVAGETQTTENAAFFLHVEKEKVIKCVKLMKDLRELDVVTSGSLLFEPQSPIGVIDAACLSHGSYATSSHNSPIVKRAKQNGPCDG